jgi:hypothetical protein
MALRITGIGKVKRRLANIGPRGSQASRAALARGAEKIKKRSVEYVPVDTGNLEVAHEVTSDYAGIHGRKRFVVCVNPNVIGPDGERAGKYAQWIHDDHRYKLGKKSIDKAANTGKSVGPEYLQRATEELQDGIIADCESAVARAVERGKYI